MAEENREYESQNDTQEPNTEIPLDKTINEEEDKSAFSDPDMDKKTTKSNAENGKKGSVIKNIFAFMAGMLGKIVILGSFQEGLNRRLQKKKDDDGLQVEQNNTQKSAQNEGINYKNPINEETEKYINIFDDDLLDKFKHDISAVSEFKQKILNMAKDYTVSDLEKLHQLGIIAPDKNLTPAENLAIINAIRQDLMADEKLYKKEKFFKDQPRESAIDDMAKRINLLKEIKYPLNEDNLHSMRIAQANGFNTKEEIDNLLKETGVTNLTPVTMVNENGDSEIKYPIVAAIIKFAKENKENKENKKIDKIIDLGKHTEFDFEHNVNEDYMKVVDKKEKNSLKQIESLNDIIEKAGNAVEENNEVLNVSEQALDDVDIEDI